MQVDIVATTASDGNRKKRTKTSGRRRCSTNNNGSDGDERAVASCVGPAVFSCSRSVDEVPTRSCRVPVQPPERGRGFDEVLPCSRAAAGARTRFRVMNRYHRRTPPTTEAAQCMLSCRSTSAAHCRRACYGPRPMSEVDIYRQGQVQRVTSTRLAYYSLPEPRKASVITPVHWRNQSWITFGLSQPISLSQR